MCRLFGFRSVLQSGVHQSLINADNAIIQQSDRHPDGWGVAYYKMGSPHLIKMDGKAKDCGIFKKISGIVSSYTVLAHIRKSTVGETGPLNTHPFQFGPWVFAHNGNTMDFSAVRDLFLQEIDGELKSFVLGETDSEVLFYYLLSLIKKKSSLQKFGQDRNEVIAILNEFVNGFQKKAGKLTDSKGDYDKNYLTFILTDGKFLIGFHGGQKLRYSTHKTKCPESGSCEFYHSICESRARQGQKVHHLIVSSEEIINENVWNEMSFGQYVGVESDLNFFSGNLQL